MNQSRHRALEQGLTSVARKVYDHVAVEERDLSRIIAELRSDSVGADRGVVQGCLKSLVENGLIRERSAHGASLWWRPAAKAAMVNSELGGLPSLASIKPPEKPDPLTKLAELAAALRVQAVGLVKTADELDALALEIEERRVLDGAKFDKFQQLSKLMKELA